MRSPFSHRWGGLAPTGAVVILGLLLTPSALAAASVLHLRRFSSPDHKVTCVILGGEHPALDCSSSDDGSHDGFIVPDKVGVCNHPPGGIYCNAHAQGRSRALPDGRTVEAQGFRCVSERGGIACIQTSGRLAGRGFWVDRSRAVKIRRPVPPKAPPATPPGETGGSSPPQLWSALERKVLCGIAFHLPGPAREILCEASPIPAPSGVDPTLGGPGFVYLTATGRPEPALISQYSWQVGLNETNVRIPKLVAGTSWRFGPLGITCSVGETAVNCVNRSGHGFTLSADDYTEQ